MVQMRQNVKALYALMVRGSVLTLDSALQMRISVMVKEIAKMAQMNCVVQCVYLNI